MANERVNELFQDEAFMKKVLVLSAEEAQKEFAAAGADITVDELNDIAKQLNVYLAGSELGEGELDAVAGGITWSQFKFAAGVAVGITIVCAPW